MDKTLNKGDIRITQEKRWPGFLFLVIFIVLTMGIGASGYFYYKSQEKQLRDATNDQLNAVADLKVKQLVAWRNERIGDATVILKNQIVLSFVYQYLDNPADPFFKEKLSAWMNLFREAYHYKTVILADAQGNARLGVPQSDKPLRKCTLPFIAEALRTKKIIFTDFHFDLEEGSIHLSLVVPLCKSSVKDTAPFGFIVLEIDPNQFLDPLIQTWPTPSKTAETLLVRKEENKVVFLNELRHRKNTALTLKESMSRENMPAVMAVKGKTGIVTGIDYRGNPVVAALRAVPGSPWYLVSKVDSDEIDIGIKNQTRLMGIVFSLLFFLSGTLMLFVWRHQRALLYKRQYETDRKLLSDRERAEETLKASETRYRRLFEAAKDGILILDAESGRIIDVNPFLVKMLGFPHEVFIGKTLWELGSFKDIVANRANFLNLQKKEYIRYEDLSLETADGRRIDVEFVSNVYLVDHHKIIQCNIRNITERKKAEEEILIRNKIADIFLTSATNDEMYYKILSVVLEVMESKYGVIGYIDDEGALVVPSMSRHIWNKCQVPDKTFIFERDKWGHSSWPRAIREKKTNYTNEPSTLTPEGHIVITRHISMPIIFQGEVIGLVQAANKETDYTEPDIQMLELIGNTIIAPILHARLQRDRQEKARKQAEEKLRYNLNFLNILIDTIPSPLYSKDVNGIYLSCNKNFAEQILGLPREKIIGSSLYELSHAIPRNLADIYHQQDMKLLQNPGVQVYEVKVQCADGIQRDFIFYKATFTEVPGKIAGIVGVMLDITDRKEAENDLQESGTKFRAVFEQTFQLVGLLGLDGTLVEVNRTALNFTGAEASHVLGKPFWETPWWTHSAEMQERLRVAIKAATNGGDDRFEATHLAGDGSLHYLDVTLKPVIDDAGHILFLIAEGRDITERKQAEEQMLSLQSQLRQSQKMEAIGRLAGGVAHDFNNLLTVISVQSQLGLRGLREGDPLKEKLKDIELAADRAANLTRQLLAFSRRQILEMKVVNLNIILTDMEKMLRRVIGEDLDLKTILADDPGMVKVDPGQMEQVIVNLAVNAKDAMPKGGKLLLETANAELDEEYTRSHIGMIPGAYVLLSITDTGIGMTEEVKEQIFDPFFTTKEKGKGTGLGLSTVYGIVKQSGGDIYVYSEPQKGTTFKVYLPRVYEPAEKIKKVTREEIFLGKETILVAEDEDTVRRLAVDILRRQGYTVLEAEAGGEALLISEQYKEPIDLILTDIVMPHMSGPEFIERLKQVRKDFKVLYMTGYTGERIVDHGILEEGIELIHKPFTITKLARKVREVLDKN